MGCSRQSARVDEAGPLSLGGTDSAIGEGVVAHHETGPYRREHLREFENLPGRTICEALKNPVPDPLLSTVDTGGQVQFGNPQSVLAPEGLFLEAILPTLRVPTAP